MNTNCTDMRLLLIDYVDGQLAPAIRSKVTEHLRSCPDCTQEMEQFKKLFDEMATIKLEQPSPALKENFNIMLQSELNIAATTEMLKKRKEAKVIPVKPAWVWMQIAASILLVLGALFVGMQLGGQRSAASEVAELKLEMQKMKEAMMLNLLREESASDRIQAVSYAEELQKPNQKILQALIHTLNTDENLNVRLAAANSINKFISDPDVVESLISSLRTQKEPLVQIVLITILTDKKEKGAIKSIQEIISNKETLPPVKEVAEQGLKKII
ncbi:MAG TPA: HEAT repeat domain-containing protein [Chitinophagaceae bacterium]|nr:HEAT repeat domain-containing protein [Chitinophagaceae bacterium]